MFVSGNRSMRNDDLVVGELGLLGWLWTLGLLQKNRMGFVIFELRLLGKRARNLEARTVLALLTDQGDEQLERNVTPDATNGA
jgi:hypothetical protein